MSTDKTPRKSLPTPAGIGADDKASSAPRLDEPVKPVKPPRKRRPRFVL